MIDGSFFPQFDHAFGELKYIGIDNHDLVHNGCWVVADCYHALDLTKNLQALRDRSILRRLTVCLDVLDEVADGAADGVAAFELLEACGAPLMRLATSCRKQD